MSKHRDELMAALYDIVDHAPAELRNTLAAKLENYADKFPRSYRKLSSGTTLIADMLGAIEESCGARISETQ